MKGIDVSHHQGTIDWSKVKDVDFAVLKCTEGTSFFDHEFTNNKTGCRKYGILAGFYHFAGGEDAIKEADYFLEQVGGILAGEFLVLDYEIHLTDPVTWCKKFLDRVYSKTGIRPLIYLNVSTIYSFDWSIIAKDYGLWIADPSSATPRIGEFPYYVIWQHGTEPVTGFANPIDVDSTLISLDVLKKYGMKPSETETVETNADDPKSGTLPLLSQKDSRWGNKVIGTSTSYIKDYGCTITCLAMLSCWFGCYHRPSWMAKYLRFLVDKVIWASLEEKLCFKFVYRYYSFDLTAFTEAIKNPKRAVLFEIKKKHWVVGIRKSIYPWSKWYKVADPWTGDYNWVHQNDISGGTVVEKK